MNTSSEENGQIYASNIWGKQKEGDRMKLK
jgi:hypothetical protein